MQVNPYLFFDGNCREAFAFYAQCLGIEVKAMLTSADTPLCDSMPAGMRDKIMHACIDLGDSLLMGSDWMSADPFQQPTGFRVNISTPSTAEAKRLFESLSAGGQVHMPLEKTFFAPAFGMLKDKFGVPWMVHCEQESSKTPATDG